jgi:hypothetical protein
MQIRHHPGDRPIPLFALLVANGEVQVASQRDHERDCVLGDRSTVKPGQVSDRDASALSQGTELLRHAGGNELDPTQVGGLTQARQRRESIADCRVGKGAFELRGLPTVDKIKRRKFRA